MPSSPIPSILLSEIQAPIGLLADQLDIDSPSYSGSKQGGGGAVGDIAISNL
jgi:hypothetical protein